VVVFGLAMAFMAWRLPLVYPPKVELGHFIMVATMLPAASMLAARISLMRQRMRAQRVELKQALARIEELATCDTLTGLLNRRHLLEVLERELQRSVRSGHAFCIAVLDLDGLRDVNRRHGITTGDQVLCAFAQEAQAAVRIVDRLGRYGGGTFVLLLCDTRAPLGRLGVERLRERVPRRERGLGRGPDREPPALERRRRRVGLDGRVGDVALVDGALEPAARGRASFAAPIAAATASMRPATRSARFAASAASTWTWVPGPARASGWPARRPQTTNPLATRASSKAAR
jgi:GGDEF domain-containing protein